MTANIEQADARPGSEVAGSGSEVADVVAQIRQLAVQDHDPAAVQRVVADVLAALDRAILNSARQRPSGPRPPEPMPSADADPVPDDHASDLGGPGAHEPRSAE